MIAAAIESCAEALTLAEKSGLDRTEVGDGGGGVGVGGGGGGCDTLWQVMTMLNSTIFDCLIYKVRGASCSSNCGRIPSKSSPNFRAVSPKSRL